MLIKNVKVFTKDKSFKITDIATAGVRIAEFSGDEQVLDAKGLIAIPGLIDIHFHGAMGHDFCNATLEGLYQIAGYEAENGITAICPATMTLQEDILTEVMKNAKVFTDKYDMDPRVASLTGINLEGPFLSPKKPGAQDPDNIVKPDVEMVYRLNEASGNKIKLIDIAPETEGALEFIKSCKDKFVISIAHTDATYEDSCAAIEAGARHITHLYNAMNPIHHRNPGPVIAAFESGAEVELIADGVHIHPAMVRFTFQIFDRDRVILISDSMEACGLADGEYQLGGQPVMKNGNLATLKKDGATVAGSVTNLFDCMKTAVQKMGIPLEDAICAATMNPARSIGISNDHGSIEVGKYADIVIIDNELNIVHVINKGEIIR